jgi:hypothetical protein
MAGTVLSSLSSLSTSFVMGGMLSVAILVNMLTDVRYVISGDIGKHVN